MFHPSRDCWLGGGLSPMPLFFCLELLFILKPLLNFEFANQDPFRPFFDNHVRRLVYTIFSRYVFADNQGAGNFASQECFCDFF
jgi:hypothetical protein